MDEPSKQVVPKHSNPRSFSSRSKLLVQALNGQVVRDISISRCGLYYFQYKYQSSRRDEESRSVDNSVLTPPAISLETVSRIL
jgi:hypothetical protein